MNADVEAARFRAEAARARLGATIGAIQSRLAPQTIARHAVDNIAEKGECAVEAAKRRPAVTGGIVAAVTGLAALRLWRRVRADETHGDD